MSDVGTPGGAPGRQARASTEAALAVVVGADAAEARRAAEVVVDRWPDVGLLTLAAVAAARWGVDLVPAVARLAAGEVPHGAMSDYEQRTAAEEVSEDLRAALDRLAAHIADISSPRSAATTQSDVTGGALVLTLDTAGLEVSAAIASVQGVGSWRIPADADAAATRRVRCLAARIDVHIDGDMVTEGDEVGAPAGDVDPPGVATAYVGFARMC